MAVLLVSVVLVLLLQKNKHSVNYLRYERLIAGFSDFVEGKGAENCFKILEQFSDTD